MSPASPRPLHAAPGVFRRWSLVLLAPVALALYVPVHVLFAANSTWDGSVSAAWGTKQNWSGNALPAATDSVTFDASQTSRYTIDLGVDRTTLGMTFNSAAGTNAFTFDNAALTINAGGIVNNDAETQTFGDMVLIGASQTWNAAAGGLTFSSLRFDSAVTLTLSGAGAMTASSTTTLGSNLTLAGTNGFTFNGTLVNSAGSRTLTNNSSGAITFGDVNLSENNTGRTLTLDGTGSTSITGVIANGGTSAGSLTKTGAGLLTISGNNTYTGVTTLSAGTLRATSSANALGTGAATLTLGGGTLQLANDTGLNFGRNTSVTASTTITSDRLTAGAGATHTLGTLAIGAQTLTVAAGANVSSGTAGVAFGATSLSASGTVFDVGSGANLALGALAGNVNVTKQGAGTLTLDSAASRSSGTMTSSAGTLTLRNADALGTSAAQSLLLNGGTLRLAPTSDAATTFNATALTVGANATILSDRGTATGAGLTHTVGSLSIGSVALAVNAGTNVTSGTAGVTFGATTLTGSPTFAVGSGAEATLGSISDSGVARTITKTGDGTLVLSAAPAAAVTSGSQFVVNGGVAQVNAAEALTSTNSYAVTVNATAASGTAAFNLNNVNQTVAGLVFGGTGGGANAVNTVSTGTGTLTLAGGVTYLATNNPAGATLSGNLALGSANRTFAIGDSANSSAELTASAVVTGTGGIVKTGAGTLVLSGTNSYSGRTSIQEGTVVVSTLANAGSASSLGAPTGSNSTIDLGSGTSTGTLRFDGSTFQSTDRTINLAGSTGGGVIDSSGAGAISFTGGVTATGVGAKSLTLTGTATGNAVSGAIVDGSGTTSLVKDGAGTWTLNGSTSNTYTGNTTVSGGTLALAKTGGAVAVSGNLVIGDGLGTDTVQLNGANQIASTSAVTFASGGTPVLNLNGNSQTVASIASANTSAQIQFGAPASTATLTVGDSTNTTYAGSFTSGNANASVVKQGTGTLTLTNASSSYTGAVTVNAGTLTVQNASALGTGTAGTTIAPGATLHLDGTVGNVQNGTLTLAGTGVGGAGALVGTGGINRWANNLTLNGDATVSHNGSSFLSLGITSPAYNRAVSDPFGTPTDTHTLSLNNHTLTLTGTTSEADNRAIYINARITGTGNIVVDMTNPTDTVRFTANKNTYAGTTTIKSGTLSLATLYNTYPNDPNYPNHFGINGPIVIGDGVGAANSARLSIQSGSIYSEMINFNSTIAINADGQLNLLAAQSIGGLTFTGGNVDLGSTGGLYLNGDVTVNASAGNTAIITGTDTSSLSLTIHNGNSSTTNRVFNVVGGVGNISDLTISSKINNGSFTKTGAGTMTITSDNTTGYEGTTTVGAGILNIQHGNALGQANGTAATGTTVNTGGTLQVQGGITVGNERLTLNGTGNSSNGALQNLSGTNAWTGPIIVNDARMQADAGTLTVNGTVSINTALDVRGAGNTTFNGAVGGSGTLTKNGAGTLTLSGDNTYGGATTINAGVVRMAHGNALGASSAGTTVSASGAALELTGGITTTAEPLSLNGSGISGNGALRSISGANTYAGQVTMQSASTITANNGASLTLTGGIATSGHALTVATTANNGSITVTGDITGGGNLIKNGTGTLTFSGGTGTLGTVQLNAGTIAVGGTSTLTTQAFASLAGSTLDIASGGTVVANYASGTTTFSGALAGNGNFEKTGAGTLVFDTTFSASGLTLTLSGGTLSVMGGQFTFGTIHITGNTVLDFNNSAGTFLSSANLVIDEGVTVTVNNWVSIAGNTGLSTIWYATSTVNDTPLGGTSQAGTNPLNQIVFNNYSGLTTTWVSGDGGGQGWFHQEIRPTPEPATYGAIFLGGCLALLGWRRHASRRRGALAGQGATDGILSHATRPAGTR